MVIGYTWGGKGFLRSVWAFPAKKGSRMCLH